MLPPLIKRLSNSGYSFHPLTQLCYTLYSTYAFSGGEGGGGGAAVMSSVFVKMIFGTMGDFFSAESYFSLCYT